MLFLAPAAIGNQFWTRSDGLQEHFHTLVVNYSGFDDTENSTFISELDEVLKVENYIKDKLDGKLFAAYGCS